MILADLPELERISGDLISAAASADEVLNGLRRTLAEIQNDIELKTYPQYSAVCESVSLSVDALNRGNDTLQILKGILAYVPGKYEENEAKNISALNRMTVLLSNIQAGLSVSIVPGNITTVEQSVDSQADDQVRRLVSDSAAEMQITNVAAVGKVVSEEYDVKQIAEMQGN